MLLINKGYKYLIEPHLKYKPIVKLDDIDIKRVREFSEIIVKAKQQEAQQACLSSREDGEKGSG